MPHYKDGTRAQLGDLVKGKTYNTDHEIVGIVIQIFEAERCNCEVAFAKPEIYKGDPEKVVAVTTMSVFYRFNESGEREILTIEGCHELGETQAFEKV